MTLPDETLPPTEPTYPDTAVGTLMRQRDQMLGTAEQDAGMAEIYKQRAADGRAAAAQLQTAIDAMPTV